MRPPGGSRAPILTALTVTLVLVAGAFPSIVPSAAAQPTPLDSDPTFFAASGYRIADPVFLTYFQTRGGVRTFGYPVSNTFWLLGKRVQIFQRQVMELRPDGSVGLLTVLGNDVLPVDQLDGSRFPAEDPDMIAALPPPATDGYVDAALSFVGSTVPDDWNGLPVHFASTFRSTVTCQDAFGDEPCDERLLAGLALEVWGPPTSQPAADPRNDGFVYQRFQRGVMLYSRASDTTQLLLLGDLFKRVLLGSPLPTDLLAELQNSVFLAQYDGTGQSPVARPSQLPGSSLADAFRAEDTSQARAAVRLPATLAPFDALTPGQQLVADTPTTLPTLTDNAAPTTTPTPTLTLIGTPATPPVLVNGGTPQPTVAPDVSSAGCLGDEQMFFVPKKPFAGLDVVIAVTSSRHHDPRFVRLTGPVKTGTPTERAGLSGWTWEWTVTPVIEGFYSFTFYADGARACITSGFNALAPFGVEPTATPIPVATPPPTVTPVATATSTPTSTTTPAPTLTPTVTATPTPPVPVTDAISPPAGPCGTLATLTGNQLGSNQLQYGGQVFFGTRTVAITSWTNAAVTFFVPASATPPGPYTVAVGALGGTSKPVTFTVTGPGC